EHGVRLTQDDELRTLGDRLESRAAQPVHGDGGRFDRQPGLETDVPGQVDRVGGSLQRVAEHHVADIRDRGAGPVERGTGRDRAELDRGKILQGAAEAAETGADAREKDDVCGTALGLHTDCLERERAKYTAIA